MALAAVGCWWFLRPESDDLVLAGGALKVRQRYRIGRDDERVRSGRWLLLDPDDRVRAKGRYAALSIGGYTSVGLSLLDAIPLASNKVGCQSLDQLQQSL